MKINFSELLASERIRPLWGRSFTQESAMDELERLLGKNSPAGAEPGAEDRQGPHLHTPGSGSGSARTRSGVDATDGPSTSRAQDAADPGPSQTTPEDHAGAGKDAQGRAGKPSSDVADSFFVPPDLAELPIRPPHEIFADLEKAVQGDLGTRATMVRNFIEALRVRVHSVDPTADEALYHPMRHAAGGTIWELLNRMEDTLSGLRRVAAGR